MTNTIAATASPSEFTASVAAALNAQTVDLVKASIANGSVKASEVPALIREIHAALRGAYDLPASEAPAAAALAASTAIAIEAGSMAESAQVEADIPAASEKRFQSIYADPMDAVSYDLVHCLIDGVGRKMIKRYVRNTYGLEWDEYLAYFGLPADYPSVAPKYSKSKSEEAKALGLGSTVTKVPKALRVVGEASSAPAKEAEVPSARRRGRPRNMERSGRIHAGSAPVAA